MELGLNTTYLRWLTPEYSKFRRQVGGFQDPGRYIQTY